MAIHVVIFPRVVMESDFYYIKVKVIFPEDGEGILQWANSKFLSLSL